MSLEPFIGEIILFGGNFAPRGWALCDGQLLPIAQNQALFSILGTTYGGDGRTTFGLPDLRGRAPIHAGRGPGLADRRLGQRGGSEQVTLTVPQIPSHGHDATAVARCSTGAGSADNPEEKYWAGSSEGDQVYSGAANSKLRDGAVSVNVGSSGGGQPHDNMPPFLTVNYIIALVGVFPPRN